MRWICGTERLAVCPQGNGDKQERELVRIVVAAIVRVGVSIAAVIRSRVVKAAIVAVRIVRISVVTPTETAGDQSHDQKRSY
jgi:predicted SPOUT superfamily RNA methylase MTH1